MSLWTCTLFVLGLPVFGQFDPGVVFRGEIVPSSGNLAGDMLVELHDTSVHQAVERTPVMSGGFFEFLQVRPGSYEVRVVNGRGDIVYSQYANISQGLGITMTIRLPQPAAGSRPVSGVVSVSSLRRRVDRKAAKDLEKAQREFQHGNLAGAVREAQKAIDRDPGSPAAHNQLAGYYIALHQPANALREFQTTVALDPAAAIAHSNLSIILMMLDRPAEAEPEARKAMQLNPNFTKAHYMLGISLVRQGKFTAEALSHLRLASTEFPVARQLCSQLDQRLAAASSQ